MATKRGDDETGEEPEKEPAQPLPNLTAYGVALANARHGADLTLEKMAEASGVARRQLIEIEHAKSGSGLRTAHALAHALGIPMGELLASLCEGHEPIRRVERPAARSVRPGRRRGSGEAPRGT